MADVAARQRRKFTADYRREAAHLVIDTGRPVAQVAKEINVGEQLLGRWVRAERDRAGQGVGPVVSESERAELERLRKENMALRSEVEFLGKACAFFAVKATPGNASNLSPTRSRIIRSGGCVTGWGWTGDGFMNGNIAPRNHRHRPTPGWLVWSKR